MKRFKLGFNAFQSTLMAPPPPNIPLTSSAVTYVSSCCYKAAKTSKTKVLAVTAEWRQAGKYGCDITSKNQHWHVGDKTNIDAQKVGAAAQNTHREQEKWHLATKAVWTYRGVWYHHKVTDAQCFFFKVTDEKVCRHLPLKRQRISESEVHVFLSPGMLFILLYCFFEIRAIEMSALWI